MFKQWLTVKSNTITQWPDNSGHLMWKTYHTGQRLGGIWLDWDDILCQMNLTRTSLVREKHSSQSGTSVFTVLTQTYG
jgi:hypothetical protein